MSCTARLTRLTLVARAQSRAGDHVLRDRYPLGVHPLRRLLRLLGVPVAVTRGAALELEAAHLPGCQPLLQLLETLFRLSPLRQAEEEAQEDLPLAALHRGVNAQGSDLEGPQDGQDVAERRVVVELQPEARGVDEDEVAGEADLQIRLDGEQRARGGVEIVERLLHRRVLDRIELEAPERRVQRREQRTAALPKLALGGRPRAKSAAG